MRVELPEDFEASQWMRGKTTTKPSPDLLERYLFNQYVKQIQGMAASGVKEVRVLFGGGKCVPCSSLMGRKFKIDGVPQLPPLGCTCVPHCKCVPVAGGETPLYRTEVPAEINFPRI